MQYLFSSSVTPPIGVTELIHLINNYLGSVTVDIVGILPLYPLFSEIWKMEMTTNVFYSDFKDFPSLSRNLMIYILNKRLRIISVHANFFVVSGDPEALSRLWLQLEVC